MICSKMKVLRRSDALKKALERYRNKKIGFVPTMGALHEGHLSLVRLAKKENQIVVASLFVNPLQFGPKEDLKTYPRNFFRDKALLEKEKVDFLFAPSEKTFYSEDFQTLVSVRRLSGPLCGASRPGHFAGVATVVLKLLNVVCPTTLYLGQKDYQQFRVVEQMASDLDLSVKVKMAPTLREADGLAMSSRNVFLTQTERKEALCLGRALRLARSLAAKGARDCRSIRRKMLAVLKKAPQARLDYAEIVDAMTLEPVVKLKKGQRALVALAVHFSKTRLIDNVLIKG